MTPRPQSKPISNHYLRRVARSERDRLERIIEIANITGRRRSVNGDPAAENAARRAREMVLVSHDLPPWTAGVHVTKVGRFSHDVVVTSWKDRVAGR